MGLFSKKYKTFVGTTAIRVIKDEALPNSLKTGLTNALFSEGGGDPMDYVMEEIVGSVGMRAERMYEYAKSTYTHGLPGGQFKSAVLGMPEVAALMTAQEGEDISLDYLYYSAPNALHTGWLKLREIYGYDASSNELPALSVVKGTTVWLKDMQVVVPSVDDFTPGFLGQWGKAASAGYTPERQWTTMLDAMRAPTPVLADPLAASAHVRVDFTWEELVWVSEGSATFQVMTHMNESLIISLAGYTSEVDHFQAKYTLTSGVSKWWTYRAGLGTYPVLDALFLETDPVIGGTFFPFAYFRYNKTSEISDKSTPAYQTSKKLVKYLGMSYDQVAEAIDENPDIADVEQAMLAMAVPAITTSEIERRYLFDFFNNLHYAAPGQFSSITLARLSEYIAGVNPFAWGGFRNSLVIQDARFKMALSNEGIFKKRVAGVIGHKGTHDSGTGIVMVPVEVESRSEGVDGVVSVSTQMQEVPTYFYRRQVSASFYDEITVVGLRTLFFIYEDYIAVGNEEDSILLVPIDRSISHGYSITEREELYSRSLHYLFNSRVVQAIEWYQQMWFEFVMIVVAVLITVASFGTAGGVVANLVAAIQVGTAAAIEAAVMALVMQMIQSFLIGMVFKVFVKMVGPKFAIILAVIAAVIGGYMAMDAGSIAGAPWAQDLLQISTGLSKAISAEMGDLMKGVMDEFSSFNLIRTEAEKALEDAQKLLDHNNWLSPFVIFGEKPNDFYNRTIHSGNIGVLSIGAISSYVDNALTLPTLDATIER